MAFSSDGQSLWTSPNPPDLFDRSDAIDLSTGAIAWDTGIAAHPAGGLVATLQSDQGATFVLFSRPGDRLRFGRYLAIRGNAYEHLVLVFEFPSLRRILKTSLGPAPCWSLPSNATTSPSTNCSSRQ